MCQLRALLNEMWGEAPGAKPKLTLVAGGGVKEPAAQERQVRPTLERLRQYKRTASGQ